MINDIRRITGMIDVREEKGLISITGIPSYTFTNDIKRVWNTVRVNNYMFVKVTRSEMTLFSFFAVEFEIILQRLLESSEARTNRRALREILKQLRENTWLARRDMEHPPLLDSVYLKEIKFQLLPHQQQFYDFYNYTKLRYNLRGMLLMVPPGGGKTISGISIACCLKADIVYIVCPNNAVYEVWEKTLLNDMAKKQSVWVSRDNKPIPKDVRWLIFHYEDLDKAVQLAKLSNGKKAAILLDESHNFNDITSLRTQRFLQLCKDTRSQDILFASGTPIKAMGSEAIPLLRAIDPLFNKYVEDRFKKAFGQNANKANEILAHRLGVISFKVAKSTFMEKEPIIEDRAIKIPNGKEFTLPVVRDIMVAFIKERLDYYNARKDDYTKFYFECLRIHYESKPRSEVEKREYVVYREYIDHFRKKGFDPMADNDKAKFCNQFEKQYIEPAIPEKIRKQFRDVKTVVKYVELKVRGECLGRILYRERERCINELTKNINFADIIDNAEKKTLIFTSHVSAVDTAAELLINEGYKPLRVYAETNEDLVPMVKQYREDENTNPMIATFKSLSTAVPLIMANTLIMLNSPFRYHEQEQAISRCNRLGQDKQVYVFRFFLDTDGIPNLSTRSEDIYEWSKQQVTQILGIDVPPEVDGTIALESEFGKIGSTNYIPKHPLHASLDW